MRKLFAIIALVGILAPFPARASVNTFSGQFVSTSIQYSRITTTNGGITGGNITIEAWIYPASLPAINTEYSVAGQEDAGTFVGNFLFLMNSGGTQSVVCRRGKSFVANNNAQWTTTLSTNTWIHLVCDYDGANMIMYSAPQGGTHTQRATVASSGSGNTTGNSNMSVGTADLNQGATFLPAITFDGLIDEVRVWNTARTTGQLDANFETELTGAEAGLRAYYQMNNTWNDLTSNAYNLTPINTPTFSSTVPFTGATAAVLRAFFNFFWY